MNYKQIHFNRSTALAFSLYLLLACAATVLADVRLPAVISDNMVLQQGIQVPIWGWAEPGEKVIVSGSWQCLGWETTADTDGRWMVKIEPPAAGEPFEMTVKGKNTITIKNILVGEVWVCSGQSNMQWRVAKSNNAERDIASANYPNIRLFTVEQDAAEQPQSDCVGSWSLCSPQTIGRFSAVAYYFGRELHKELNVPIGLIHTSWGGTPVEAWTKREVLESDADFVSILERYAKAVAKYPEAKKKWEQKIKEWEKAIIKDKSEGKKPRRKPRAPMGPGHKNSPSGLYNAMLAPLVPYGIAGAIWYQGEANVGRAYQYRKLFPAMIENWRNDWQQGDFPFYYVQLAPYKYRTPLVSAELREAQLMTLSVPNTGMAVIMDIGDVNDIHPKNKQDVGKRLALWAMAKTYGRKGIVYSGPIYKSMKVEEDKIRLFFVYVDGGLAAKNGTRRHFTIAGEDRQFVEAKAVIDGDTIVVSSDKVKNPVAVRFAWSNTAVPNFFNKSGLPASPFRTDDWPGVTVNKK